MRLTNRSFGFVLHDIFIQGTVYLVPNGHDACGLYGDQPYESFDEMAKLNAPMNEVVEKVNELVR